MVFPFKLESAEPFVFGSGRKPRERVDATLRITH
jgi:hypothetical protein